MAIDEQEKIRRLLATRDGYERETIKGRFLMDAYLGCGGFSGEVKSDPISYWGPNAVIYARGSDLLSGLESDLKNESYLDQFQREDEEKYRGRVKRAHYPNYVAACVDIPLSYMNRKPFVYRAGDEEATDEAGADGAEEGGLPDNVKVWMDDVDGSGTTWEQMKRDVIQPRARVLGWCPVLVDAPVAPMKVGPDGQPLPRTKADDIRDGIQNMAIPLFPANLVDYDLDKRGRFVWAKVVTEHTTRPDPLGPSRKQLEVRVWWTDRVDLYVIEQRRGATPEDIDGPWTIIDEQIGMPHPYERVPLVIFRDKAIPDDPIKGAPSGESPSVEARRLFNLHSELDEFMRGCAFALLQIPAKDPSAVGKLEIGQNNAIGVHPDSRVPVAWITPDSAVSDMFEKRIEATIEEIHRMGRIEFSRAKSKGNAQSGVSRAFEFENTNRSIADFARNTSRGEEEVLKLTTGVDVNVVPPTKFDVEEMAKELEEVTEALALPIGPTGISELVIRTIDRMLPNLEDSIRDKVHTEIRDMAKEKIAADEQQKQAERELLLGGGDPNDPDNPDDPNNPDDQGDGKQPPQPSGKQPPQFGGNQG